MRRSTTSLSSLTGWAMRRRRCGCWTKRSSGSMPSATTTGQRRRSRRRSAELEEPLGMKLRKFIPVLYVAVMGRPTGIPLFDSLAILGRERALARLRAARARLG
ncbi:hypothetical protein [Tepidiforma sp.]|uniref:hypothetical protein n=1 Tax=Tepidiforma sp. TaxID=2682230 RepID=UPI0035B654CC